MCEQRRAFILAETITIANLTVIEVAIHYRRRFSFHKRNLDHNHKKGVKKFTQTRKQNKNENYKGQRPVLTKNR